MKYISITFGKMDERSREGNTASSISASISVSAFKGRILELTATIFVGSSYLYIRSKFHKRSPVTNALLALSLGLETSSMA